MQTKTAPPSNSAIDAFLMLPYRVQWHLIEATRRYTRFRHGEALDRAWTGLGCATEFKQMVRRGLMEPVYSNPGYTTWWRLTKMGAAIVQSLLDLGITYETIEDGRFWVVVHHGTANE